jgi:hypothetical protein
MIGFMVLLGCCAILVFKGFLFSEASELLVIVLERGVMYRVQQALVETRPAMWLFMTPVILTRQITDHLGALVLAFGIGHAFVPLLSVTGVLYGLRRHRWPEIFIAVSAICLLGLPGQSFAVSGQLIVAQLFWLLLVCLVNEERGRLYRWSALMVGLVLFFLNPVVASLFGGTGAYLLYRSFLSKERQHAIRVMGICLLAAAVLRGLLLLATSDLMRLEDSTHPSLMKLQGSFSQPRTMFVVVYFTCVLAACLVLLTKKWRTGHLSAVCLAGAAIAIAGFFAGNPMALQHGVNYLGWVFALSILLYASFLHLALSDPDSDRPPERAEQGVAFASLMPPLLFVVMLVWQGLQFDNQIAEVRNLVEHQPRTCVDEETLFADATTSLKDSFGVFEYVYLATGPGRFTSRVVLDDRRCQDLCRPELESGEGFFFFVPTPGTPEATRGDRCPLRDLLE